MKKEHTERIVENGKIYVNGTRGFHKVECVDESQAFAIEELVRREATAAVERVQRGICDLLGIYDE